jgi:hypothetical protein
MKKTVEKKSEALLNRLKQVDESGNLLRDYVYWLNTSDASAPIVKLKIKKILKSDIIILDIPKQYQNKKNRFQGGTDKLFYKGETRFRVRRVERGTSISGIGVAPITDLVFDEKTISPDNRLSVMNIFILPSSVEAARREFFDKKVLSKMKEIEQLYILKNQKFER